MPLSDPFNFDTTDPNAPGLLGQSPSWWADLARFGGNLAASANARDSQGFLKYGGGLAGPLGAAITDTMQQGQQQATARADLAARRAQTLGQTLQNQGAASTLPVTEASNRLTLGYLQNPALTSLTPGSSQSPSAGTPSAGPPSSSAAPSPTAPSDYATAVIAGEGGGRSKTSSAAGVGQFTYQPDGSGTWNQYAKENPQNFTGMTQQQIADARFDPKLGAMATDWLAKKNAPVLTANGVQPTGPNLAIAHYLGPKAAAAMVNADSSRAAADVLTESLGPQMTQLYVNANPNLAAQTAGGLRNHYANIPNPSWMQGGSQGQNGAAPPTAYGPQQTEALAKQYEQQSAQYQQQANDLERQQSLVKMMQARGVPMMMPAGDPALYRTLASQNNEQAMKLRSAAPLKQAEAGVEIGTAGEVALQRAINSNVEIRPGGLNRVQTRDGPQWVKNPDRIEWTDPLGNENYAYATPPVVVGNKTVEPGAVTPMTMGQSPAAPPSTSAPLQQGDAAPFAQPGDHVPGTLNQVVPGAPGASQAPVAGQTGAAPPAEPPSAAIAKLGPVATGNLTTAGKLAGEDIEHDRGIIEKDIAHVIDNAQPAQQMLLHLRSMGPEASTGAGGEFRAQLRNYIETFAPKFLSKLVGDAAPMQEYIKSAFQQSTAQERDILGSRGGAKATEMWVNANPSINLQDVANGHIVNVMLIGHQRDIDYAQGAADHYLTNRASFAAAPNKPNSYTPLISYDSAFMKRYTPELYVSAMDALNQKPDSEWSKGLSPVQSQMVAGIIKRADPNATIIIQGHVVPVSDLPSIEPTEIMSPTFGAKGKVGQNGG